MDQSQLIGVLQEIVKELNEISGNTTKGILNIGTLISSVTGAFIAAGLGILTSLYLDARKEKAQRIIAIKTIAAEMELALNTFELLRKPFLKNGQPYLTEPTLVYSPILSSDSFNIYRSTLMNIFDKEKLTHIEDVYRNLRKLDDLMRDVISLQSQTLLFKDNKDFAKHVYDLMKLYWVMALSPQSSSFIENGRVSIKSLLEIQK